MLVPEESEYAAVERVAARFGGEIHHAAVEPAELCGRAVALNLELLNGVDNRVVRDLARLRLQDGDAVEQILVRARPAPVDAGQHGVRRQGYTRCDGGERDEQTAVQRELDDLFMFDNRTQARAFPSDRRCIPDHGHLFLKAADREIEIDARLLTGRQPDALAAHGLEARELEFQAVLARCQAGHRIHAIARRDDDSLQVRPSLRDGDDRAGNGGPTRILHHAGDFAGRRLRTGGYHRGSEHTCDGQTH